MFPKAIGVLPTLQTPTISAVVQDGTNYYVTYTLGTIQSMYPVTVDFLVADVVILSSTLNPQAPTAYTNANQAFGTYAQGAAVKVRVTSLGQVYTSAAFTTTYALFSPSTDLTDISNVWTNVGANYEAYYELTCPYLSGAGYYNAYLEVLYEWKLVASGTYTENDTENVALPVLGSVINVQNTSPALTPTLGGVQLGRVSVRYRIAGYSGAWLVADPYNFS